MKKSLIIFLSLIGWFVLLDLLKPALPKITAIEPVLLVNLLFELLMFLLFFFLNRRFFKQKILLEKYHLGKGFGILWLAWLGILFALLQLFLRMVLPPTEFVPMSGFTVFTGLILFALVGVAEEYIFRGMILGALVTKGKSLSVAVITSSLLFGLTHAVNLTHQSLYDTGLQMLGATVIGVFLAAIYVKSNNLFYPIIMHASWDFMGFVGSNGNLNSEGLTLKSVLVQVAIFGLIAFLYFITGRGRARLFKINLVEK